MIRGRNRHSFTRTCAGGIQLFLRWVGQPFSNSVECGCSSGADFFDQYDISASNSHLLKRLTCNSRQEWRSPEALAKPGRICLIFALYSPIVEGLFFSRWVLLNNQEDSPC